MHRAVRFLALWTIFLLLAIFLSGPLPFPEPAQATSYAPGRYVIWSDGFASGLSRWVVWDENPASGSDYWGTTTARRPNVITAGDPAEGITIWCAQAGTGSGNGRPNSENRYYDTDMNATLMRETGDLSAFAQASLRFYYWAVTGPDDYLSVWELSGGSWMMIWRQPSQDSSGWQYAGVQYAGVVNVSTASTAVAFRFLSGSTVGPQANEGVYIDFAVLTAYDDVAPSSEIRPIATIHDTRIVLIEYTAWDTGGSGIGGVELLVSTSPSGPRSWFGRFNSTPIAFEAPSDGTYYFFSVAFDRSNNHEPSPDTPDAWTIIDTIQPTLAILSPAAGRTLTTPTVVVSWDGSDVGSGVDRFEVELDGGPWISAGTEPFYVFGDVSDGIHVVSVRAIDRAGNVRTESVPFAVNTDAALAGDRGAFGLGALSISAALVAIFIIAAILRRRRKSPPSASR